MKKDSNHLQYIIKFKPLYAHVPDLNPQWIIQNGNTASSASEIYYRVRLNNHVTEADNSLH